MRRILSLTVLFTAVFGNAIAQPNVQTGLTLEQYVNEILLGDGIDAFNIELTGIPAQVGYLTGAEGTVAPIGEGLVLSTANATNLDCSTNGDVGFGGISGNPDLLSIANSVPPLIGQNFSVSSVNDVCILEFDFVAAGDSLSFNYFFGSDEYLTWVNSQFNDVFAFFLAGPGISGPYSAPPGFPDGSINIAILPDTDPPLPITISSVNNNLNSDYYIHNIPNGNFCQNGITTSLTAEAGGLLCGETYHIMLAIADGSDASLESIVVIEAGSFSSNDVFISATIPNTPPNFPQLSLLEGCIDGFVTVFRPNVNAADTVFLNIGGTATPGEDYIALEDFVVFDEGETTIDIPIITIFDGIEEGIETITISYDYVNACDEETTVEIVLNILDYALPELDLPDELLLCNGDTEVLSGVPIGGFAPFNYDWSTGQSSPTITVGGNGSELISLNVTDYCESEVSAEINVIVPDQNLIDWEFEQINAPGNFPENSLLEGCIDGLITISRVSTSNADVVQIIIGGSATMGADYENIPTEINFEPGQQSIEIPITTILDGANEDTETITITYVYIDGCEIEYTETITLSLLNYNLPNLDIDNIFLCEGSTTTVSGLPAGGYAPFSYDWSTGESTSSITVEGGINDAVFVEVVDYCENETSDDFLVEIPDPIVFPNDFQLCLGGSIGLQPTGGEPPYSFDYPTESMVLENGEFTPTNTGTFVIEYTDACGVSGSSELTVIVCETVIPNIFSPNNDGVNDVFFIQGTQGFPQSRFEVYNRWGTLVYENDNYQSNWRGDDLSEGTYFYIYYRSDGERFAGNFELVRTTVRR